VFSPYSKSDYLTGALRHLISVLHAGLSLQIAELDVFL